MKRTFSILILAAIFLQLTGCGQKPEAVTEKYFSAARRFDFPAIADTIVPSNKEDISEAKDLTKEDSDEYTKYFLDYLKTNASKMTYKITGSEVKKDKAVVTADCKYVDGGPLLRATIGEAFSRMLGIAFSGAEMSDEETNQMFQNIMEEQSKVLGEKFKESTISINCIKQDNKWYIEEINDDLLDVVMSGFISAGKELSDIFDPEDGESEGGDISEESPEDVLFEISNYVTGDIWNDGFNEISWYLKEGTGSFGQELDIDFTKSQLDKAMKRKAGYDEYIRSLGDEYRDIKEIWEKLSPQIDTLYQQVQTDVKTLNTDLFEQYRDVFSDAVYDLQ